ncbi:MAG: diguanylate cyclase [Frankiales bacterium]|nr:diguanylate cyclase [Frankiales bacterium]
MSPLPEEPSPEPSGAARDRAAAARDEQSDTNDLASHARDERSDARDERAEERERQAGPPAGAGAARDRSEAKRDRAGSAHDRQLSGRDRAAASSDRVSAAAERALAVLDGLTGAHHREPGLAELDREVVRAHRTGQTFVLAFVDVDHLKETNDSEGHAAGDALLVRVADAIRTRTRSYDLLVRHGGDEFLCGFLDLPLTDAQARFTTAKADLADQGGSFSVGLAQLLPGEQLDGLVERADRAMYDARHTARP